MSIPNFDHNYVLPPHLGDPITRAHLSPYLCNVFEVCKHFSTSSQRVKILKHFIAFRQRITTLNVVNGFQWLDGSFIEDIETSEGRDPNDLDLVTFYGGLSPHDDLAIRSSFPEFSDPVLSKNNFFLDHYAVDYSYNPDVTVEQTRYWLQLFTHNRRGVWKGIIKVSLNTPAEDIQAMNFLNSLP
ncbi:MAG: hypothetical protein EOO15_16690 [Chitinophagaceae bacterium]|nr:MAG: hypothetical protein EOO15_16690 [Chitinophagaceae bacterium]